MIRFAQLYTGGVGAEIVRRCAGHPQLELVAVLVHADDKAGKDSGTLVGADANGIVTTQSIDDVLAARPDAVIYSGMQWDVELFARLLRAGVNVYTGLGGYYLPGLPEFEPLDAAGRAGNASFTAGGNIPGLISDVFPLFLTGYTGRIRSIRAWQRNDVSTYESGAQIQSLGIGKSPDDDPEIAEMIDVGFGAAMRQSANMIADGMGIECTDLVLAEKRVALASDDIVLAGFGTGGQRRDGRRHRVDVRRQCRRPRVLHGQQRADRRARPRAPAGARASRTRRGASRSTANRRSSRPSAGPRVRRPGSRPSC